MDNELLKMLPVERKSRGEIIFALCIIAVLMIGVAMAAIGYFADSKTCLYWGTGTAFGAGFLTFVTGSHLLGFE